jgi:hypothetical protein
MIKIIAFEGSIPSHANISWGTAAIYVDGGVLNPVTRRRCSMPDYEELVATHHVTPLPIGIEIDQSYTAGPTLVLVIREGGISHPASTIACELIRRSHEYIAQWQDLYFAVFRSSADLDLFAADVIPKLFEQYKSLPENDPSRQCFTLAFNLDFGHPMALAMFADIKGTKTYNVLYNAMKNEPDRMCAFDEAISVLQACRNP